MARRAEADMFYEAVQPKGLSPEDRAIQRQAWAGLLWSKQFYHFDVSKWISGVLHCERLLIPTTTD